MELDGYIRFLLALLFVLGLIGLLTWLARRLGLGGRVIPTTGRQQRIGVTAAIALDGRRRLVLLRRDDVEHLVILGPNSETVVESGIPAPEPDVTNAQEPERRPFKTVLASMAQRQFGRLNGGGNGATT